MGEFKKGREQVERELQELRESPTVEDTDVSSDGGEASAESDDEPDDVPAEEETAAEPEAETEEK